MSNESAERMAASPSEVELGGVKYALYPLVPADFAAARRYFRDQNPSPLDKLKETIQGLPEAVQVRLAEKAYEDDKIWGNLNTVEGRAWAVSIEGTAFFFWSSVRKGCDVEFETILMEFKKGQQDALDKLMERLNEVSGFEDAEDKAKKLSGSRKERRRREAILKKAKKKTGRR